MVHRWLALASAKASTYQSGRTTQSWDSSLSAYTLFPAERGDEVVLWRVGKGGGVVALGEVAKTEKQPHQTAGWQNEVLQYQSLLTFDQLFFSAPASPDALLARGLESVVKAARSARKDWRPRLVPIAEKTGHWEQLCEALETATPSCDWPGAWNIPPGSILKRAQLHAIYGGNQRVLASASGTTPNAFLFIRRPSSEELAPRWDGRDLLTPGHVSEMDGVCYETQAVLAHRKRGIPLRVFELEGADCRYIGEFAVDPVHPLKGWAAAEPRPPRPYSSRQEPRQMRTPLLRLRQVNGERVFSDHYVPFESSPRQVLTLRPVSEEKPDPSSGRAESTMEPSFGAVRAIRRLLHVVENDPHASQILAGFDEARALATLVQHAQRREDLDALRAAAEDPHSTEHDLQKIFERMTWIFGGEFLPGTGRRQLTVRDQLDLALLRPDGTMHGVEIKRSQISNLVTRNHSHLAPGPKVYEAFSQAANYLQSLDEERPAILTNLGVDCRRASMTVVIGHRKFVAGEISAREIAATLRNVNSLVSRVTLTTYDQLIDNAEQMLSLSASDSGSEP